MRHNWYIIDRWGRRSVNCRRDTYWSRFDYRGVDIDWPEFSQFVTRASPDMLQRALSTFAEMLDVQIVDVTDDPAMWDGALIVVRNGGATCVAEPGLDLDERLLRPESASAIAGLLADDGAFFGFDPAAGTVHVTRYDTGVPTLEWFDSTEPGPSHARTFQTNGRATDEDPRAFALRYLGLPESSPLLDRLAFVRAVLDDLGMEVISPELDDLPVTQVLRLAPTPG